ncbi:hypothetical protein ACJMK2_014370, partial [Sinanodonta woodiana]
DRHIHAACTHHKPKLKKIQSENHPCKGKHKIFLNHYLSRHVPHRNKITCMFLEVV